MARSGGNHASVDHALIWLDVRHDLEALYSERPIAFVDDHNAIFYRVDYLCIFVFIVVSHAERLPIHCVEDARQNMAAVLVGKIIAMFVVNWFIFPPEGG